MNEFLDSAVGVMASSPGPDALDSLGWWDLLDHLDDPEARSAVFAAFRAQGRTLASSPALGALLAQPYGEPAVAAIGRRARDGSRVWTLVGEPGDRPLLFDEPEQGVHLVDPGSVELIPVEVPGRTVVHEVVGDLGAPAVTDDLDEARARSAFLGRVAAAAEILGAAERAVDLAVEHARDREQFGQPIGTFQAVRHLLAWATTDCVAVDSVVATAVRLAADPPDRFGGVVKALAGRNGRRACERSLQVLGGIGFTAEHDHHHLHSRVLLLDGLLGTSAELSRELGRWLRSEGADPRFASAVLLGP